MIDSIWVLEFNSSGTQRLNHELIDGAKIINKGYAKQLLPQLSFKPTDGSLIICIANCDSIASFNGITKSTVNNCFSSSVKYYHEGESLPMYGEMTWSTSYTCDMTRAVAKIQVQMGADVSDVTGNFTAENVSCSIFDIGSGGYIQPKTPVEGIPQIASGENTSSFYLSQNVSHTGTHYIYIYEYPTSVRDATGNAINDTDFNNYRQYILLEKDNGSGNPQKTYYRLDFYNPVTGKFIDTKRNHHYIFTIQKVRSEGYEKINDAQNNPGGNIEYTVTIDDNSKFIVSNGQYAIVTSVDTAYVPAGGVSDFSIATAKYVLPKGMSLYALITNTIAPTATPPGTMTLGTTGITTLSASNGNLKVTTNASFTEGIITLTLGNITHRLPVKAKP
jgi:hypothetical protein